MSIRRGFTLLEVLVVVAILGIVIAAIGACLAAGMRVWDSAHKYAESEPQVAVALAILERDVINTFPFYSGSFSGTADSVTMPALMRSGNEGEVDVRRIGTVRYSWVRDRGEVMRKAWVYPLPEPSDSVGEVLARSVQRVRFRYGAAGEPDGTWRESWTDSSNAPFRVGIDVELSADAGGYRMERTVVRMVTNGVAR